MDKLDDEKKFRFRCDECGKFIPIRDFDSGAATRTFDTPDSHYSCEEFVTLCKDHRICVEGKNG